jgi:hypothetical protein
MIEHQSNTEFSILSAGMGFLPAVAAAPVIGPGVIAGVSAIGGAIASFFGFGGDDQQTNYRPPANTAQVQVRIGNDLVSFDLTDLRAANAAGNRTDDIFSYYSAFVSNSVDTGASKAAKKVILDAARIYGVSIAEAAAKVLEASRIRKIITPVQSSVTDQAFANQFLPSRSTTPPSPLALDKIIDSITRALSTVFMAGRPSQTQTQAPSQTQTPRQSPAQTPPINPPAGVPSSVQQQLYQQALAAAATIGTKLAQQLLNKRSQIAAQSAAAGCDPASQYFDPFTNQCAALLPCPQDQYFEPTVRQCVSLAGQDQDFAGFLDSLGTIGGIPVWILALLGLVLIASRDGNGSTVSFRRRRKRR